MPGQFGLFINLDYAHKSQQQCHRVWERITATMLDYGFEFKRRAFAITTDRDRDEISQDVRHLFDRIQLNEPDFYSYVVDCYILDVENCNDLTLPDTTDSIEVEDISLQDLNTIGVDYDLLFKKNNAE